MCAARRLEEEEEFIPRIVCARGMIPVEEKEEEEKFIQNRTRTRRGGKEFIQNSTCAGMDW